MSDGFIDELREVLRPDAVLTGDQIEARYFTDMAGVPVAKPRAVVRARTTEDVSNLLRLCHRDKVPVTTQGGMTGLVRATMPQNGEIVLSMELMNAIEEIDTSSGVAIVQAGAVLQKVQERVEDDGFTFPLDLGARGSCTIGGNISTNAGGNRVIRYGMTRDLVLGLEVVRADGTVLHGLRKYIKNNTGVDLKHLFIGTEGVLGVVTRAALRLFPAPAERQVALCALSSFDDVTSLLRLARTRLGGALTAFEVMWNEYYRLVTGKVPGLASPLPTNHPFYVLFEASGGDADRMRADLEQLLEEAMNGGIILDATISTSNASAAAIWRIRDSSVELSKAISPRVGFDISLAIDRMEDFANRIAGDLRKLDNEAFSVVYGHLGDGNLHVVVHHADVPNRYTQIQELVYGITGEYDGSISAEHGIGMLKKPFLKLSRTEDEIETMRMLKRSLDPHNILNPGRIFTV